MLRAGLARAIHIRAADEAGTGAERDRRQNIDATSNARIPQDLRIAADDLGDPGKHVDGRRSAIELAASVIRYDDRRAVLSEPSSG